MNLQFRTLSQEAKGVYKEKGSRFEAFAYPVVNEDQILGFIQLLKGLHHKARHHCYAYRLGVQEPRHRSYDDGEPRHSAGDPILGQLRSRNLTNVLVVVVRYFGGTKLGIGRLTNAYKEAASRALDVANIVLKEPGQIFTLTCDYPACNKLLQVVKDMEIKILDQIFEHSCKFELQVPMSKTEIFRTRLSRLPEVKVAVTDEIIS